MISIGNIYWMMAYAFHNINAEEMTRIKEEDFDNIYELFCVMLTMELSKLAKRGFYKEYIELEEELSYLKGKILMNESIKKNSKMRLKMYCSFDDYSPNIYLNMIIKTACSYLKKSNRVKDINKLKKLNFVLFYLKDVEELRDININWSKIKYTKRNQAYKVIMNICYLIFNSLLMKKSDGNIEYRDYIDDQQMHKLYEKFVLEYYRYHHAELHADNPTVRWNVFNDASLLPKMYTDIALYYKNKMLIIDTKYYSDMYQSKLIFDKEKFRSHNLYQIYTYVKNQDVERNGNVSGMLLYAKTDRNEKQWASYNMDGNHIIISNLDLSKDFDVVKGHLELIVERFKNNEL